MLEKKTVVITGASSGLGAHLAKKFAQNGANLLLSARRLDKLKELQDQIKKICPKADVVILAADVGSKDANHELIEKCVNHFGGLDVFVANAGQGMWSRFRDLSDPDQLKELMQINYMGVVYGLFYALAHLRKSLGSFVAISSIQGVIPVAFHTGYVASKFAVNGFIETVRLEEPDIHFLLALPSWISGTELRAHALGGVGDEAIQVKKTHGKSAVSAQDCAKSIINALALKKREIYIPKKYCYVPLLRNVCKPTFDKIVFSKVKGQLENDH